MTETHAFTAGQRVARINCGHWRMGRVEGFDLIKSVFKNYVLTASGKKYCFDGSPYPFRYSTSRLSRIEPATDAHVQKIKAEQVKDLIGSLRWEEVPDDIVLVLERECGNALRTEFSRQKAIKR